MCLAFSNHNEIFYLKNVLDTKGYMFKNNFMFLELLKNLAWKKIVP